MEEMSFQLTYIILTLQGILQILTVLVTRRVWIHSESPVWWFGTR